MFGTNWKDYLNVSPLHLNEVGRFLIQDWYILLKDTRKNLVGSGYSEDFQIKRTITSIF